MANYFFPFLQKVYRRTGKIATEIPKCKVLLNKYKCINCVTSYYSYLQELPKKCSSGLEKNNFLRFWTWKTFEELLKFWVWTISEDMKHVRDFQRFPMNYRTRLSFALDSDNFQWNFFQILKTWKNSYASIADKKFSREITARFWAVKKLLNFRKKFSKFKTV